MNEIAQEANRRKTFAIISHPDAGKTTLTEKLLLFGGAIRLAGTVKGRKANKYAVSDWMEIEKQRGISVTSSVMYFDYKGRRVNILDTPGHQDFSEDTYRTLMAADSAVMLIDGAKGVEEQTKKLFHVCRLRGIPIFTFVNKLDRHCKHPFDLMAELEEVLGIRSCPMNWPVGVEGDFRGLYNRENACIELYKPQEHGLTVGDTQSIAIDDKCAKQVLGDQLYGRLTEEIELLDVAGDPFDLEQINKGQLTPLFFGSAMTNFGVGYFLDSFIQLAPSPGARKADVRNVEPCESEFSGFVFKIQANMDPAHRDRLAFVRICSGKFEKGLEVRHSRSQKTLRISCSQQFFAQDRVEVEEAYAGDIIGVFDTGNFCIGDTLCCSKEPFSFEGIPMFPAEHFAEVAPMDVGKRKQFLKGISQIAEEGAIQTFKPLNIGVEKFVIGVVGALQFEVLEYRMKHEYGVELRVEKLPFITARWISADKVNDTMVGYLDSAMVVEDSRHRLVILYKDEWTLRRAIEKNPDVKFMDIPPAN